MPVHLPATDEPLVVAALGTDARTTTAPSTTNRQRIPAGRQLFRALAAREDCSVSRALIELGRLGDTT